MNNKRFIAALAAVGFAVAMDANAAVINFQENDSPANTSTLLGLTATFTDGGASLTAAGFGPNGPVDLYAKFTSGDPTETGLGLVNDPSGDHEITVGSFIQLTVPPSPAGSTLDLIIAGSVQANETALVFFGTANGVLGATPILGSAGPGADQTMYSIGPFGAGPGYIDITAGNGNVLLDSATVTVPPVPDGGMTVAMLGGALSLLGLVRRKLVA